MWERDMEKQMPLFHDTVPTLPDSAHFGYLLHQPTNCSHVVMSVTQTQTTEDMEAVAYCRFGTRTERGLKIVPGTRYYANKVD